MKPMERLSSSTARRPAGGRVFAVLTRASSAGAIALMIQCTAPPDAPPDAPAPCPSAVYAAEDDRIANPCSIWLIEKWRNEAPHWVNPIEGRYQVVGWPVARANLPWEADVMIGEDSLAFNPTPDTGGPRSPRFFRLRILERTAHEVSARACPSEGKCRRLRFQLGRVRGGLHRVLRVTGLLDDGSAIELWRPWFFRNDCDRFLATDPYARPPLGEGGAP